MSGYLTPEETQMLALNVERLRAERGWSQESLSVISGVHVSTLRALNRTVRGAQARTLERLADAFEFRDAVILLAPLPEPGEDPDSAPPAEPVNPAQAAFNQQIEELRRIAARHAREHRSDGDGDRVYALLTGRIRQMRQALQAERRKQ